MDDLLSEFLTETNESMETLDLELVNLEKNPNDPALLSNIFRLVHTIKGTCGFLGLPRLERLAHSGENILGKFRSGEMTVTPEAVSLILESLDQIKAILTVLEQTESEPAGDDNDLITRLDTMAEGGDAGAVSGAEDEITAADVDAMAMAVAADPADEATGPTGKTQAEIEAELEAAFNAAPGPDELAAMAAAADPTAQPGGDAGDASADGDGTDPDDIHQLYPDRSGEGVDTPAGAKGLVDEVAQRLEEGTKADANKPASLPVAAEAAGGGGGAQSSIANQSIRVNVEVLETLMTMVSELVLTRNQLLQILRQQKDSEFNTPLQRLNQVVSELQDGVMKTRMQPIGTAWAKLPRIVRDLSHELNKKIELVMNGQETELDRQVIELIRDPLTHMIRNSADHGIESLEERRRAGKSDTGRINLNAYHEGGHIIIEISDDGKGLPLDKIKAKAIANQLVSASELDAMTDQQVQQLIFRAGFSTAEAVTSVSGRGVGMDVVRTNIERIGGTIDLSSQEGKGSVFTIKIPLTLAIVSALIVACNEERFAIPQISVLELVRTSATSDHKIERIKGTPVLRLRNRLLPLVSLRSLLGFEEAGMSPEEIMAAGADSYIVVSQVGNYIFGIIVDQVFDTEEIVVKPVSPVLRHIEIFSGNTILGDGSVIMILDPNGIANTTGEIAVSKSDMLAEDEQKQRNREDITSLLMFRAGNDTPKAVPLALVARLEDVDTSRIEYSSGSPVIQYRGQLMPLIPYDDNHDFSKADRHPILVFADDDRSMGLVVDEIVDIVEDTIKVQLAPERDGLVGSAIISGQATEVIDVGFFLNQAFADWFSARPRVAETLSAEKRILLVDDSPFFRNLMRPLLVAAGYAVTTVDSAGEALDICNSGELFDAIVSDIEMPGMSGFELAHKLKQDSRWRETPLVALSAHASERDLD
ncbi:MAG: chemotaxis protein CheW, partial [Pseudomonadota bacterium]